MATRIEEIQKNHQIARKKLEEANWKILDQAKLGKIWPAIIKQLGQPYIT